MHILSPQERHERREAFMQKFPSLPSVLAQLQANRIDYMIGGSGCLFLLGNDRIPDDVDIYLRNEQHGMADRIFSITSFEYLSLLERVRNSNPGGDHDMQLTSHLEIMAEDKRYDLRLDKQVMDHGIYYNDLVLYPPEDVVLIKALLQRGADVGKHDVADIHTFMKQYTLDMEYLRERIMLLGAMERVGDIFT